MAVSEPPADPGATPSRVRVLDPEEAAPRPAPQRSFSWVLLAFGGVMVIGLWLTGVPQQAALLDAVASDARALAAPGPRVPDLSGMRIEEARDALIEAGFVGEQQVLRERWLASEAVATGQVTSQTPTPGTPLAEGRRVTVEVSSGGPVVRFDSIPADIRSWAAGLPGFDPAEPVLVRATAAGFAYKTDGWLFGDCTPVALAVETFPDSSYGEECMVRTTVTVTGVLPDGTGYEVGGLPGGGYPPEGASGAIMFDRDGGAAPLGVIRYDRTANAGPALVEWRDSELHIAADTWSVVVLVNNDTVPAADQALRDRLALAIHPRIAGEYVLLELDAPLRFQTPGEVPSRLSVNHGSFRVVVGCVTGVRNVVCDPSGALSVEGAHTGFDLAGVTVTLADPVGISE
jgi:hypothetical protein